MFRLHSGQPGHVVKLFNVDVPQDTDLFVNNRGQPRHVVKLPTRACLGLTDRGDKNIKHYTIN